MNKQIALIGNHGIFWRINNRKAHLGKKHTEESKQKIRIFNLGKKVSEETKEKHRKNNSEKNNPNYGNRYQQTEETKQKMKDSSPHIHGEKHCCFGKRGPETSNWKGGISFEEYPEEFNNTLKQQIRERDNFTCQLCHIENGRTLDVHHIDYNKKNCNPWNLLALCRGCNNKANSNRKEWTNFFLINLAQRGLL